MVKCRKFSVNSLIKDGKEFDNGGVRTLALSDWRLKPAPWTTRPHYLNVKIGYWFCLKKEYEPKIKS